MCEIVSFDLAKKLKEKGFTTANTDWCYLDGELVQVKKYVNISPYEYAPTISQVLKWLREKYIQINIGCYCDNFGEHKYTYWNYEIIDIENAKVIYKFDNKQCMLEFESYEEVAITGVKYVLNNLI